MMIAIPVACFYFWLLHSCSYMSLDCDLRKRQGCGISVSHEAVLNTVVRAVMSVSVKLTQSGKDSYIVCFVHVAQLVLEK